MTDESPLPPAPEEEEEEGLITLQPDLERHLLTGLIRPGMVALGEEPLEELTDLVEAAGAEVVGTLYQKRQRPHQKTYLGKGKLQELVNLVKELKPHTVVVDDDLSPSQLEALETAVETKVIDRSEVILDIFASRARTYQARLQVMLAQAQYELPRLGRKWTHLERLGGGIGTRGPGESQIETDRRLLRLRIKRLKDELADIEARKAQEVGARRSEYTISLVGYTNAGKSTLMNALTQADTYVEDQLFATLDTLTRSLELEGLQVLLSDTVGFIRRLPHHLVASFHATLEETTKAKLLLHVVDASSPIAIEMIRSVNGTLSSIKCRGRDHIYVFNKVDQVSDPALLAMLQEKYTPNISVSAITGEGLDEFRALLREKALEAGGHRIVTVRFSSGDGRRLAVLNQHSTVQDLRYEEADAVATVEITPADLERVKRLPGECTVE
ncbi:MAG: GTPase HflX [Planctomycetota bacterium]|jgi:GTP-binding protein HflX